VRNRRKLVRSERTKGFASKALERLTEEVCIRINVDVAIGRLNEIVNRTSIEIAVEK
jgi:hypothetical protein